MSETTLITAVEITAYDPDLPGTRTLYFSDARLVTGAAATPAHQWFDDRIQAAPNFERRAFGSARVTSGGQSTGGVLELANADHALSYLLDLGLDGRDIVVRTGTDAETYPTGWTTWLTGTVRQVEVTTDKAILRLKDRMAVLDLPLQANRYAGTNSGGPLSGAEGVATDIKGQPKPLAWGRCYHVPTVLVNTGMLTYQVHDGSVHAIDAVYDKGAALTFGADRANLAALEAAAIAAGSYDTCKALGLFRLGASPAGRVTADVRGDNSGSGYVDRPGAIWRRVLEAKAGQTGKIDTASVTALDAAANCECGIWIGAETTIRPVTEAILSSVGAAGTPDRTGQWTATQLVAPSGTPAHEFVDADIETIQREATNDPGGGIPVWQVTLRYKRHWAAFGAADLVAVGGSLTEAQRAELLQEWRTTAPATDAATQTLHLLATTLERDTLLISATDAAAERDRLLALHKPRRDYVRLSVAVDSTVTALDVGDVVTVTTPALGYSAGRAFAVLGLTREVNRIIFDLWG